MAVLVVVAPTKEHQDTLAVANTTGKQFFAIGGKTHLTEDDLLIGQRSVTEKRE
jgi:hypothetical protein